jgi:two-component system LytT family response regulator
MPRILIVDDEELARLRLTRYFRAEHPDWPLAEAADGFEAHERIAAFAPDLIFLDIEMPEMNGFELLMQLPERPFKIIFQTAYDEFAVRAFDESACDYLLKPFTDERLKAALTKAGAAPPAPAALADLERRLASDQRYLTKILIRVGNRMKVVELHEVLYFFSEEHVTRAFLKDIDYAYDASLSFLEERLDPRQFVRSHRNSILNLRAVTAFTKGQRATVTLSNGAALQVSRERRKAVLAALGEADT